MTEVVWIPDESYGRLPVRQVYAFIFATDGRVLLQDDAGRHNLPGGKPQDVETLVREVLEESQATMQTPYYISYQRVAWNGEVFAQLRYVAVADELLPVAEDIATGRVYGRLWVPPPLVNHLLGWGDVGRPQVRRAVREAEVFGAR